MKRTLTKAAVTTALVAAALLAVPAGASAYTPPTTGGVSDSTVAPGGTFSFSVSSPVFEGGETVTIYLTGENASGASLGFVKFAVETSALGTQTAAADGTLAPVSITLPADASGSYTILATSPSNPVGVSATVSATGAASADGEDDGLAATGADGEAMLALWVGGGALLLAGGGVAAASAVRRNRKQADAA
ncbi:hypothetical protein ACWGJP_01960 [Microbacterium sp. NPDC055903]